MVVRNKYRSNALRAVRVRKKLIARASLRGERFFRLSVFRSNAHFYAQLIDDVNGVTVASASSVRKKIDFPGNRRLNAEVVRSLGHVFAERSAAYKNERLIFDRGGRLYVGLIKVFGDAVRDCGFKF